MVVVVFISIPFTQTALRGTCVSANTLELLPWDVRCVALQGFARKVRGRPDAEGGDSGNRKDLINVRDMGAGQGRSI